MRFQMSRRLTGGQAADPDPRTAPEDVPFEALLKVPLTMRSSDTIPGRFVLTLEGTAAQTASVEIWTEDDPGVDRQAGMPDLPTEAEKAARLFYNSTPAAAIVITVGELLEFPTAATHVMPNPGTVYIRVTAVPAADSVLKVEPAR